jgi:hypothetical protein
MTTIRTEVSQNGSESAQSLIRKFTRAVQERQVLAGARSHRNYARKESGSIKKKRALAVLGRRAEYERLAKLGKIQERKPRRP